MPLPTELFAPRQLVSDPVELLTYATDAGPDHAIPDGVVFPESAQDVVRLVEWANERGVPLVTRGAGTGLAGGAVAEGGGIVVVTTRMSRILEIDRIGRCAVVESGTVNLELEKRAGENDLYYPPDPASGRSSLIGGNLGTNAGGPHCFKYGVTTNYVQELEVVLANGEKVTLGGRALDYPEYDLAGLVVGSEGTLAIITRAVLKLRRRPPAVRTVMAAFDSLESAGDAVSGVIAAGLVPATLEAIDQAGMRVIEEYCPAGLPVEAGAVLIVEVDGYAESLAPQTREVVTTLERHGATDVRIADTEEERQRIWHGRKSAAGAMARLAPNYYLTDITVRRSRLAAVLGEVNRICRRHDLRTASFFHAGDGNLHPLLPCDARDRETMRRVERALDEIVALCLAEDGSITGEHGVGLEKRAQMARMHGGAELSAMYEIKQAFDPDDLLNPGKVLPESFAVPRRAEPSLPPGEVFAPATAEEAAGGLRALAAQRRPVRIGDGDRPARPGSEVRLETTALRGVGEFAPEDLFLTVGAGTPVAELDATLRPHRLTSALLSPWSDTTIGGLVATNLNAPQRLRYGSLRDVVLAAGVALTDGRLIRAGRPLVKNVAGYDLPKVLVGSHGSLGLLTEITLKLTPAPRARRTLSLALGSLERGLELAFEVLPLAVVSSGVVLAPGSMVPPGDRGPCRLLYTAEGLEQEVEAELGTVTAAWTAAGGGVADEAPLSASQAWAQWVGAAGTERLLVRAGIPPRQLSVFLAALAPATRSQLLVDCPAGTVWASYLAPTALEARSWLDALRGPARELGGYAVVVGSPPSLRTVLDPWGYRPSALAVMKRLKELWDPAGILDPGFLERA